MISPFQTLCGWNRVHSSWPHPLGFYCWVLLGIRHVWLQVDHWIYFEFRFSLQNTWFCKTELQQILIYPISLLKVAIADQLAVRYIRRDPAWQRNNFHSGVSGWSLPSFALFLESPGLNNQSNKPVIICCTCKGQHIQPTNTVYACKLYYIEKNKMKACDIKKKSSVVWRHLIPFDSTFVYEPEACPTTPEHAHRGKMSLQNPSQYTAFHELRSSFMASSLDPTS